MANGPLFSTYHPLTLSSCTTRSSEESETSSTIGTSVAATSSAYLSSPIPC
jgi:hypothetical protein